VYLGMNRSLGVLFSFACVVIAVCQAAPVFADVTGVARAISVRSARLVLGGG